MSVQKKEKEGKRGPSSSPVRLKTEEKKRGGLPPRRGKKKRGG